MGGSKRRTSLSDLLRNPNFGGTAISGADNRSGRSIRFCARGGTAATDLTSFSLPSNNQIICEDDWLAKQFKTYSFRTVASF